MSQALRIVDQINDDLAPDRLQMTYGDHHPLPATREAGDPKERRTVPRWPVQVAVLAVPVQPNGAPDWDHRSTGVAMDLSAEGVGLLLRTPEDLRSSGLVVVFQVPKGAARCVGVEVRHTRRNASGELHVGGRFGGHAHELLRDENLTPAYCPQRQTFVLGFPDEILRQWAEGGILQPIVCDRVQLCPLCGGLPTFRRGCPTCGSARVVSEPLLHHFACAHVDRLSAFEGADGPTCPKCLTRRLVVGTDFEYLQGPFRCQDCNGSDGELEHVGQCLSCGFRFPGYQSRELELRGYRAHRLDPLAFHPAPGATAGLAAGSAAARRTPLRPEQDTALPVGPR